MSRILITSALPYINGIKHLGNLAGSMLPADVYARFKRAQGHEVLYICATDEHGTPAELAAAAAGQDVKTYCDEQHEIQKAAGDVWWPTIMHFVAYGGIMMPLGWWLAHKIGVNGLVWAVIIASLASSALLTGRFVRVARRLGSGEWRVAGGA